VSPRGSNVHREIVGKEKSNFFMEAQEGEGHNVRQESIRKKRGRKTVKRGGGRWKKSEMRATSRLEEKEKKNGTERFQKQLPIEDEKLSWEKSPGKEEGRGEGGKGWEKLGFQGQGPKNRWATNGEGPPKEKVGRDSSCYIPKEKEEGGIRNESL